MLFALDVMSIQYVGVLLVLHFYGAMHAYGVRLAYSLHCICICRMGVYVVFFVCI